MGLLSAVPDRGESILRWAPLASASKRATRPARGCRAEGGRAEFWRGDVLAGSPRPRPPGHDLLNVGERRPYSAFSNDSPSSVSHLSLLCHIGLQGAGASCRGRVFRIRRNLFYQDLEALGLHPVAQQLAWGGAGAGAVLEDYLAVDDGPLVACGALDAAPFVARQVVEDFDRLHRQFVEVVDYDVGGGSFAQRAAIFEARAEGGQRGQAPVDLFEGQPLLFTDELDDRFGREAARRSGTWCARRRR